MTNDDDLEYIKKYMYIISHVSFFQNFVFFDTLCIIVYNIITLACVNQTQKNNQKIIKFVRYKMKCNNKMKILQN